MNKHFTSNKKYTLILHLQIYTHIQNHILSLSYLLISGFDWALTRLLMTSNIIELQSRTVPLRYIYPYFITYDPSTNHSLSNHHPHWLDYTHRLTKVRLSTQLTTNSRLTAQGLTHRADSRLSKDWLVSLQAWLLLYPCPVLTHCSIFLK